MDQLRIRKILRRSSRAEDLGAGLTSCSHPVPPLISDPSILVDTQLGLHDLRPQQGPAPMILPQYGAQNPLALGWVRHRQPHLEHVVSRQKAHQTSSFLARSRVAGGVVNLRPSPVVRTSGGSAPLHSFLSTGTLNKKPLSLRMVTINRFGQTP